MEYLIAVISTSHIGIEHVSNLLIANGVNGFEICDSEDFEEFLKAHEPPYDYIDDKVMQLIKNRSCIKFYTAVNEQGRQIINSVENSLLLLKAADDTNAYGTLEMNVSCVSDDDWKDNWKQYYKPIEIGEKLLVTPAWESVLSDRCVLKIDPGMAFGTGSHETTALCLELLQKYDIKDKAVLDIGCGSGILSQAAVLFGAKCALGCDIDEAAVTCAISNAKLNGLQDKVQYKKASLTDCVNGKYDVVMANIVADVIISLLRDINSVINENCLFISSGIIAERVCEVRKHIEKAGFKILEIREKRGWAAICAVAK